MFCLRRLWLLSCLRHNVSIANNCLKKNSSAAPMVSCCSVTSTGELNSVRKSSSASMSTNQPVLDRTRSVFCRLTRAIGPGCIGIKSRAKLQTAIGLGVVFSLSSTFVNRCACSDDDYEPTIGGHLYRCRRSSHRNHHRRHHLQIAENHPYHRPP